ncbi:C25 family cysteine peptidase [Hymenobacter lucidus]|uniref:C25 family cysteine peptidase n=1 Tax=Hymenobacter lucidus TaxID=2880930 RepID=A0ABS8AT63_9BACT|nr:C25 family cysteine peptidase [Hymenobacter lucidus]MCB2408971.1 C25 family cysteine peptidase [Hymenobacter lucidus]
MTHPYQLYSLLRWCALLLGIVLLTDTYATAQSGPYGNEWIVPAQQYYKIRVTRDGLHRLDYTYLRQAGITSADPSRFQLWRRGREVAIYVGGNSPTTLDASTFIEFYGQRNDGALDVGMYKTPADHYQKLYSMYTDTAAYFLTVASTATGRKRMEQVNPAPVGGAHPYWIYERQFIESTKYIDVDLQVNVFQPWAEQGEGFSSGAFDDFTSKAYDSLQNHVASGRVPHLYVKMMGANKATHRVTLYVVQPNGVERALGPTRVFENYELQTFSYPLLVTDIDASGKVVVHFEADKQKVGERISIISSAISHSQPSAWNASRGALRFHNDSTLGSAPAYYSLDNLPATVRGFDVTDPYNVQRVEGRAETGTRRGYVFPSARPGSTQRNLWLVDEAKAIAPLAAVPVRFRNISPAAHNFLIVTHQALMKPAGDTLNPVREYAKYRASTAGGRYDTLVVTTDRLYDQFHYGEKSALAIRQFALFMLTNSRPKSLLLLGKGLQTGEAGYSGVYHRKNQQGYSATVRDLVPASTRGASEAFFTADWQRDDVTARMATGRIAAQTSREVLNYLNKLVEHEVVINQPDAPDLAWRKNALNVGGGQEAYEFDRFGGYLNEYKRQIESPLFAGRVVRTYARTTTGLPEEINIASELNAGLAIITYFGHGSIEELSLGLGNIRTNPAKGYNNRNKYPVMFVNGCAAGNTYSVRTALYAEDWLLVPKKGLIGFMSESSFGFEDQIHTIQKLTFQLLLNDPAWYGKPVAEVYNEVSRRLQSGALNSYLGHSTLMNTIWHGDPAVRLFSPAKPDFAFGATPITVAPVGADPVRTNSRQFKLLVQVRNPGKVTTDKVDISVKRIYDPTTLPLRPDTTYTFTNLAQPLHDTTYELVLANSGNSFGNNQFTVTLDYQNRVDESNETNNQATTSFVFLRDGITLLNPPEFAIVATNKPRLVGQTNNPNGPKRAFLVELDTTLAFNSTYRRTTRIEAPLLADWRPTLPVVTGRDSVVWYWRMRFETKLSDDENEEWVVSSFRVINNSPGGWSQSHHGQFQRDERRRVDVTAPAGKWAFADISQSLTLQTQGGGTGGVTFRDSYGLQIGTDQVSVLDCGVTVPNILVSVFDGSSLKSLRTISGTYDSCGTAPNRFYHFAASATDNINSPARQQQLLNLLNNVPRGAYVTLLSVNKVNFSSFSAPLKAALAALGSQKITQLQDGDPFAFIGQKGPGAQAAVERTADLSSSVPRAEQIITLTGTIGTKGGSGVVTSTRIGPAQEWTTLYHTIRTEASDSYTLRVVGIDTLGVSKELYATVPSTSAGIGANKGFSLAGVPAKTYPYLQLVLTLRDTAQRTAPQVKQLLVTYKGMPEGIVRRDSVVAKTPTAYDPTALAKQAADSGFVRVPVIFQNVSGLPFGTPLKARFTLRSSTTESTTEIDLPPLGANGTVAFDAEVSTLKLYGDISGSVTLNINKSGRRLPELYYFNNDLTIPSFKIEDRGVPPVLDVAFDGQRILNGDIVSPRPIISVVLTDEDKLRPITDRSAFDLVLTPRNGTPQKINLNAANVIFTTDPVKGTARIDFEPGQATPLLDGQYTLEVQGRDATGRTAGAENYKVAFEVINASTITNVFPYPNPIIHKARFVFTLTGAEVPRNMKIQIMTLTGKVVRQIMMSELGTLRIGNNITEYAWDGTDEYGDRLANGTYLYRVVLDDPTSQFERRTTAADQAFKNGWGKLVLLR